MSQLIQQRISKAYQLEKELEKKKINNESRLRSTFGSSPILDAEIKRLSDLRETLPPKRNRQSVGNDVAFWAGGTFEGAIYTMMHPNVLNPDGDKEQANFVVTHGGTVIANQAIIRGNIYANDGVFSGTIYAKDGEFNGKITSNHEGDRLIIDPVDRSMKMINALDQEVVKQDFFINNRYSGGQIQVNLVDQSTGENHCYAVVDGGMIAVYRDNVEFARFDAYQKKIWIDADLLPQGRDNAYPREVYMDGETMKIKREV